MLIGLGHSARVGKDTCAALLVEHHGFRRVAFADVLRDFVYRTNPYVASIVDSAGWEKAKTQFPNVRQTLIDVGNVARKTMGEDVWIRAALHDIEPGERVVVSDVRYPNEVDAIRAAGGIAVKVTRPGFEPLPNIADEALASYGGWDGTISNDGTLDDLRESLDLMMTIHAATPARRGISSWGAA